MTPRRHSALALCLFCFTALVRLAAEPQWTEVVSPNFNIITDAGEKRGREAALRFEQIRGMFSVMFQKAEPVTPVPLQIVAFHSNKELRRFANVWKGKPVELAGLYVPGEDRQFILVDMSSETGWQTVFHEYTHLLLHSQLGELPVWFDEGFAEYFSSLRPDRNLIHFGEILPGDAYILNNTRWMKIAYLFAVQHNSSDYNENGDHRSVLYSESWIVAHYLYSQGKLRETAEYLNLTENQHVTIPEALQRAFGMTPEQFDKTLQSYYRGGLKSFHVSLPPLAPPNSYTSRSMSEIEADAILADLHLHEPDYAEQALTEFQQVLEKQPNNAIAHRGLGYALLRKRDYAKAEEHLKIAIASGAADARTHYLYALLLMRKGIGKGEGTVMISSTAEIDIAALKSEAQAAIALDPNFADAYNLLAYAQARERDFSAAVVSEVKAFKLDQYKHIYLLNLAQYEAGAHNLDEAERLLKLLLTSNDPALVNSAQSYLQYLQTQRNFEEAAHNAQAAPPPHLQAFQPSRDSDANVKTLAPQPPGSVQFMKGKIVKVDCSTAPGATVGVMVGNKLWAMTTPDRNRLVLIGADAFSCEWHNRNVAVNVRVTGDYIGQMISLELQ